MLDLATVREYLRVDDGVDEATLQTLLGAAIQASEDYCGRVWESRFIAETHHADGAQTILLRWRPVVSVDRVTIDGEEVAPSDYDALLDIARIYRYARWRGVVEVIYEAGYGDDSSLAATLPTVRAALLDTIAHWYNNRANVQSVGIQGAGTVTYASSMPLPVSAMAKLRSLVVPRA